MKTTVYASAGQLDAAALQSLLAGLAHGMDYLILANIADRRFTRFDLAQAQNSSHWVEGQAFGPAGALNWRRKGDRFRVCWISEQPDGPEALPQREDAEGDAEEILVPLWGEHRAGEMDPAGRPVWFEAQIPRLLDYPLEGEPPRMAALRVRRYRATDGTIAFQRFVSLEGSSDA